MASNRTMDMALGKLGKGKPAPAEDEDEGDAPAAGDDSGDEDDGEKDDKKEAFVDMCKAIKSGDYDKAYELYQDICEGM